MALIVPYLPLNPLLPRPKGAKGAEGMKKQIPSNKPLTLLLKSGIFYCRWP